MSQKRDCLHKHQVQKPPNPSDVNPQDRLEELYCGAYVRCYAAVWWPQLPPTPVSMLDSAQSVEHGSALYVYMQVYDTRTGPKVIGTPRTAYPYQRVKLRVLHGAVKP